MIVIMNSKVTSEEIEIVIEQIKSMGLKAESSPSEKQTIISITGDKTKLEDLSLESMKGVDRTIPSQNTKNKHFTSKPNAYDYSRARLEKAKSGNKSGKSDGNWTVGFGGGVF